MLQMIVALALAQGNRSPAGVVNGEFAYMLDEPMVVADHVERSWSFSPSGRYILATSVTPPSMKAMLGEEPAWLTGQIVVGDVTKHSIQVLQKWRVNPALGSYTIPNQLIGWAGGADTALILDRVADNEVPNHDILRIQFWDVKSMTSRPVVLGSYPNGQVPLIRSEPSTGKTFVLGATEFKSNQNVRAVLFDSKGNRLKEVVLPNVLGGQVEWADPTHLGAAVRVGKEFLMQFTDITTGKSLPPGEGGSVPMEPERSKPKLAFSVSSERPVIRSLEKERRNALVLVSSDEKLNEKALITADGDNPVIAPGGKSVAYQTQSVLMVSGVQQVPKEMLLAARRAKDRLDKLLNAKQVALAAIMYANDHKDMYPSAGGFLDAVGPYLSNSNLADGFNYTFGGGLASSIESPAQTEMGYISVEGGRIVAYTDGHVKFVRDPSKP